MLKVINQSQFFLLFVKYNSYTNKTINRTNIFRIIKMPRQIMDIDKFKAGLELIYPAVFLGSHTTKSSNIPEEVSEINFN